jgi:hypothetical protein
LMIRQEMAVEIVDQTTYNVAVERRTIAAEWLKNSRAFFKSMKDPAYAAWKKICENENLVCEPVDKQIKRINAALINFDNAQAELRRQEQIRLQQIERERSERERLENAVIAEQQGMDEETVEAVLETPVAMAVVAPPTYERSSAVTYRDNWQGVCDDLFALVKAVAKDRSKLNLLQVNQSALNARAKSDKSLMNIPGVRAVNNRIVATGRR